MNKIFGELLWLSPVDFSTTIDVFGVHSLLLQKQWSLGFGVWFFHTPPPQSTITQILHNPFDFQLLSCSLFKHVYDSFSWVGKLVGNNVCSSKTWHKQVILQEVLLNKTRLKAQSLWYSVFSFGSNCSALCIILHNMTTPPAALTSEKTKLFIHEPRGIRVILNYINCGGNDLFSWTTCYWMSFSSSVAWHWSTLQNFCYPEVPQGCW